MLADFWPPFLFGGLLAGAVLFAGYLTWLHWPWRRR